MPFQVEVDLGAALGDMLKLQFQLAWAKLWKNRGLCSEKFNIFFFWQYN